MPKVTAAHQQARRQQLLDAARRCFARRGFAETSVRDIYEEAGLSAGSVYVYFQSKEEIVEALAGEILAQFQQSLAGLDEADDPLAALDGFLPLLLPLAAAAPPAELGLRVQAWGAAVTHPRVAAMLADGLRAARTTIVRTLERGGASGDHDATARAMVALFQGYVLQLVFDPPADPAAYAQTAVQMLRTARQDQSS
jgi:AcrR family transcriptional regulator